mmetsp:Transcript_2044/g.2922  ORF Transcript_2044/g.2922 Transcript_2044/m.2922 type:complete len:277 (+) Transcript_2044:613-1443(+)
MLVPKMSSSSSKPGSLFFSFWAGFGDAEAPFAAPNTSSSSSNPPFKADGAASTFFRSTVGAGPNMSSSSNAGSSLCAAAPTAGVAAGASVALGAATGTLKSKPASSKKSPALSFFSSSFFSIFAVVVATGAGVAISAAKGSSSAKGSTASAEPFVSVAAAVVSPVTVGSVIGSASRTPSFVSNGLLANGLSLSKLSISKLSVSNGADISSVGVFFTSLVDVGVNGSSAPSKISSVEAGSTPPLALASCALSSATFFFSDWISASTDVFESKNPTPP